MGLYKHRLLNFWLQETLSNQVIATELFQEDEPPEKQEQQAVDSALDEILGSIIGEGLDFLSKELVRVRQEREIAEMVRIAERTRRMREVEESARRQAEEQLRQREDAQFTQIMQIHQDTARTFLEDILEDAILSSMLAIFDD
jgi:hypothetical protein